MIWFLKTSYSYINPCGLIEHLKFIGRLPGAWLRYWLAMREGWGGGNVR